MKIEIIARTTWMKKIDASIAHIEATRREEDAAYEAAWLAKYNKRGWLRYLIGPLSPKPVRDKWTSYPSYYAWGDLEKLKRLKQALSTEGTGAIYVTGDELRAMT